MKDCCQRAWTKLRAARDWAGKMAVHECYNPEGFQRAQSEVRMIELHLELCGESTAGELLEIPK